jgi:hypothetical protein
MPDYKVHIDRRNRAITGIMISFLMVFFLFLLPGCIVQSLCPFYTKESVCNIEGISGEWKLLDDKGNPESGKPWIFQKDKVIASDKSGSQGTLKVTYFRTGESFFMDTIADDPSEGTNKWWVMHVFPVHVVTKVEIHDNTLTLTPIDYNWIEKTLKDKTGTLPHILNKDENSFLFTASPQEWIEFLKKYSNDVNVFSKENALRFIR